MSPTSKREYLRAISHRYRAAARPAKHQILTEVCATTGYHRKAVIRVLNRPPAAQPRRRRRRTPTYGAQIISVLAAIWEAAGYPWSVRLKALLLLWQPWARPRLGLTPCGGACMAGPSPAPSSSTTSPSRPIAGM